MACKTRSAVVAATLLLVGVWSRRESSWLSARTAAAETVRRWVGVQAVAARLWDSSHSGINVPTT